MDVTIQTLTPLWTGGVETGECDRIHETGILGSLRWWMEALVRGLGGQEVCDPTAQTCSYDPKKPDNGLCDVCQIFGATGWKRRFRLEVQELQISDAQIQHPLKANRTYTDHNGKQKTPTWYFQNSPKSGLFTLKIQPLHPIFQPEVIGGLIQFVADWSAVGARPQMGFGVIQIIHDDFSQPKRLDTRPLYDWLIKTSGSKSDLTLPGLSNIFLAKIQAKDSSHSFQEKNTFDLKYDIRQLFRTETKAGVPNKINKNHKSEETDLRHFIMGTVKEEREAAKIKVSRPYDNGKLIRLWGWIPEQGDVYNSRWNREKAVNAVHQHLTANYKLEIWREMNSARDTVTPSQADNRAFLASLLDIQEEG
jgi:CRISPR-associated protein Cmr1